MVSNTAREMPDRHVHPYLDIAKCKSECPTNETCVRVDDLHCPLNALHFLSHHPSEKSLPPSK